MIGFAMQRACRSTTMQRFSSRGRYYSSLHQAGTTLKSVSSLRARLAPSTPHLSIRSSRCISNSIASSSDHHESVGDVQEGPVDFTNLSLDEIVAKVKTLGLLRELGGMGRVYLEILGTGSSELSPTLYVHTDRRRYMFNCGEACLQLLYPEGIRQGFCLDKTVLLITRAKWQNICGVFSLLMFKQRLERDLLIVASNAAKPYVNYLKRLSGLKSVQMLEINQEKNVNHSNSYSDEDITITPIELRADSLGNETLNGSFTTSYVCKLADMQGKFDAKKANELCVPSGPMRKVLMAGRSIITDNGSVVHSSDVVGDVRKGSSFFIVDCPDLGFVSAVTSNPLLQREHFESTEQDLDVIIHLTPRVVLDSERYSKWMTSFGTKTKHLLVDGSICPPEISLRKMMRLKLPLHLSNPAVFHPPLLTTPVQTDLRPLKISELLPKESIFVGRAFMRYSFKPLVSAGLDLSRIDKPIEETLREYVNDLKLDRGLVKNILHRRNRSNYQKSDPKITELPPVQNTALAPTILKPDDALVTFLGTSASSSTMFRNVSCILVQTPTSGNVMMDCGDGALMQLYKCFGQEAAEDILLNLNVIFISHIHADHHTGLFSILRKREELLAREGKRESTQIIGSPLFASVMNYFNATCEKLSYKIIDPCKMLYQRKGRSSTWKFGDLKFEMVPVIHTKDSHGLVIRNETADWSIVYSADTRPCLDLVEAGQNATLLIHEATFGDELLKEAETKLHSMIREAIKVGHMMKSNYTVLTHFSTRYSLMPLIRHEHCLPNVMFAFDFMSLRLSELNKYELSLRSNRDFLNKLRPIAINKKTS